MSRWKAATIHLLISATLGTSLLILTYFVLYPPPLFRAMGGSQLTLLVTCVDVVLGPLLTLAVFKSGKRGLKIDLTVIGVLQLSALTYGFSVVWLSRPVFILVRDDIAYVMAATDISDEDLKAGPAPEFQNLPWFGPRVARLQRPAPGEQKERILELNIKTGKDIQQLPEFYRQWASMPVTDLLAKSDALGELRSRKPEQAPRIDRWLRSRGLSSDAVRYLSLLTFQEDLCLAIDARTGAYLGVIDADPS